MLELDEYINDHSSDVANLNMAMWYERQNHLSPAISFYMRCAENTKDDALAYECIVKVLLCFSKLGNRDYTCENLIKTAINLIPSRPEAYYYASQFYEHRGNWLDAYFYSSLGLSATDGSQSQTRVGLDYKGRYSLLFQKAISAWWRGRPAESRVLLKSLMKEGMDDYHRGMVQHNLSRLGAGPDSQKTLSYDSSMHPLLRFKFDGSDKVKRNFSQVYQDLFVLAATNGKMDGTYLEVGSAHAYHNSNTALLESFGWRGVGIEMNPELASQHEQSRKNKVLCADALKVDYESLLSSLGTDVVDYLQLDIEPSKNTFEALISIPFDKYKFRVITYEHDHYVDMTQSYREKSRRYLRSMGYTLMFNDISPDRESSFEDWWVKSDLIDPAVMDRLLSFKVGDVNFAHDVMLNKSKMEGVPPVHYVSIEESDARRKSLLSQLESYGIKDATPHVYKRFHECGHVVTGKNVSGLHDNSKGPVTSHLKAIKNWLDTTTDEVAFMCEDDLSLRTVEDWNFSWADFYGSLPADWDCVQLVWVRPEPTPVKIRRRLHDDWCAAAYLIRRDYARLLVDRFHRGEEFNLDTEGLPIVENVIFGGPGNVYNIPVFVEEVSLGSTYTGDELPIRKGQGEFHIESNEFVSGWWRENGATANIKSLAKIEIPHIHDQPQFGENWFTFPELYKKMVAEFPSGSRFVEVGCWKGKSAAFMAVEIANSGKNIDFACVDTWEGSEEHKDISDVANIYDIFTENMRPVENYYRAIRLPSVEAASQFEDESLDFVFVDASHEYEDVKEDINAWLPKVKPNGILAGHDYYPAGGWPGWPGVRKAVEELLENFDASENCFIFRKVQPWVG